MNPTTPQQAAGWRIEPPVSEPKPPGTNRAATAAALPPEEPPGIRSRSQGLRVTWLALFSVEEPIANSSMLARPMKTAPASRRRAATVESAGGRKPSRIREAQVVRRPATQMLSLIASGTPASGSASPGRDAGVHRARPRPGPARR